MDDDLIVAVGWAAMEMALATTVEAIFNIMGEDCPAIRQCPLVMDKWESLVVSTRKIVLGINLDTNTMAVFMTLEYVAKIHTLLDATWHKHRQQFMVSKAQSLTGKLAQLAEGAHWGRPFALASLHVHCTCTVQQ